MRKILIIVTILILALILIFNLKNIYKVLPLEKKVSIKNLF